MFRIGKSHKERKKISVCHGLRVGGNRQGILGWLKCLKIIRSAIKLYIKSTELDTLGWISWYVSYILRKQFFKKLNLPKDVMPSYDDFCHCCVHSVLSTLVLLPQKPHTPPFALLCAFEDTLTDFLSSGFLLSESVETLDKGWQKRKRGRSSSYPSSPCWASWLFSLSTKGHSLPEALFLDPFSGFLVIVCSHYLLAYGW